MEERLNIDGLLQGSQHTYLITPEKALHWYLNQMSKAAKQARIPVLASLRATDAHGHICVQSQQDSVATSLGKRSVCSTI